MCTGGVPSDHAPRVLHDFEPRTHMLLEPVDSVTVTTLMDNVTDQILADQGPARRLRPGSGIPASTMTEESVPDPLVAEHGFSALVTVVKNGHEHRFLFDAGTSPDGVVENMRRLRIDPASIEAIICSHGHFDHTTGLDGLIRALGGRVNLPVLIHPHFWRSRRMLLPGAEPMDLPTTSRGALEGAGFTVIEEQQPSFLFEGSVLVTGEVPRTTGYEPGFPPQQAWLGGKWEPDPLVLDDQALIIDVRDKGLMVLTGCGHAGVVNICRYARRLTYDRPLHAVVGGFHLNGPVFESLIPQVLADLGEMTPSVLIPAHCTGWRAQHAMAGRFGDAFVPNTVGTAVTL
ncbi:MBL fold metallo-hydrolase [Streptomyces sp. NBC_01716]|uniref:MBL fold metallo-hydrolase n=1 Tax=Streptomyces sp. NBC_01716 TaxID=2975917 RepID=UPI002E300B82|nr:MBL fold metallo-hydrolase [Streptomyces sp. NBC_01716]